MRRLMVLMAASLVGSLAWPVLGAPTTAVGSAFPGANGKIAFDVCGNEACDVYSMNPDGSGKTNLTNNGHSASPSWSADGTKIAFVDLFDGSNLSVMNGDGTGVTTVASANSICSPSWSPDGTRLVYEEPCGDHIHSIKVDGTGDLDLNNGLRPVWSPNGAKIAFYAFGEGARDIWVMNPDGSGRTQVTNDASDDLWPDWSPDGTQLAFSSNRGGPGNGTDHYHIWAVNANGSGLAQVTSAAAADSRPAWSPDGTKITMYSTRADPTTFTPNVYVINSVSSLSPLLDGLGLLVTPLTTDGKSLEPDWQPLGVAPLPPTPTPVQPIPPSSPASAVDLQPSFTG